MFRKLLKHELRHQKGLMTLLCLAPLAGGGIGLLLVQLCVRLGELLDNTASTDGEGFLILALVAAILACFFLMVAITGCGAAVVYLRYYRFYKHHFTDEGYLTFTLPATTHQLLWANILTTMIWAVIASVCMLAGGSMIMVSAMYAIGGMEEITWTWNEIAYILGEGVNVGFLLLYAFTIICAIAGSMILPLLAITIGSQVARKHKLLASIGIYFGLQTVVGFVSGVISIFTSIADVALSIDAATSGMTITLLTTAGLELLIAVGGYFLIHHFLSERLNLT